MFSARSIAISLLLCSLSLVDATPIIDLASRAEASAAAVPPAPPKASFNYTCTQPPESKVESQWSSEGYISQNLPNPITPPPVFWSGQYNGKVILPEAEACAQKVQGATIGQLMCNLNQPPTSKKFLMPADGSPPSGNDRWNFASLKFAQYTGKTAYVVTGDAYVTSIWFRTEWPALKANLNVDTVVSLNPNGCAPRCHWYCKAGTTCQVCL